MSPINLVPLNLFEFCQEFASQELFGLAIASTMLCLSGFLVAAIARRKSAATRFWVWQMAGSGTLLACVVLALTTGIPLRTASIDVGVVENATAFELTNEQPFNRSELKPIPFQQSVPVVTTSKIPAQPTEISSENIAPKVKQIQPATASTKQTESKFNWSTIAAILVAVWAIVFVGHLVWFVGCIYCCYRIVAVSSSAERPQALKALIAASNRIGNQSFKTKATLYVSEQISVPFTIGIIQPKIVLPMDYQNWTAEKLEMVIAHELAHIQRRDVLWHWVNRLACCLAWFNPLIWIAAKRGIFERERACDDQVIQSGIEPIEYGQSLIEIAASMSGRPLLAGGVSMAEPPLKQRLQWILAAQTDRQQSSIGFRISIGLLFVGLTCAVGFIRPLAVAHSTELLSERLIADEPELSDTSVSTTSGLVQDEDKPKSNQDEKKQEEQSRGLPALEVKQFKMCDSVTGVIETHDGKPAAGINVELNMYSYGDRRRRQTINRQKFGKWTAKTDFNGIYTIDTSQVGEVPADTRISIDRVYHSSIVDTDRGWSWSAEEVSKEGELSPFKLQQGREISGQIVDANGNPIQAIVRAAGVVPDPNLVWFVRGIETDQNGRFKFLAPINYHIGLMAMAPGHVATHIAVPGNEIVDSNQPDFGGSLTIEDLKVINGLVDPKGNEEASDTSNDPFDAGAVQLETGAIVKGKLLDGDGKPIAGVAVGMDTAATPNLKNISFDASFACLTDETGSFEFPPASGKCSVFVAESVHASDRIEGRTVKGKLPPRILPEKFELDANAKSKELTLREITATQKISGTIKWDSGVPVAGIEVVGGASPNVKYGSVFSDENGNYEIEMPRPLKDAYVTVMGAKDERGVWHSAVGFRTTIDQIYGQYVSFDSLDGDEAEVNWELRELRSRPRNTPEYNKAKAEFVQLQKLSADFYQKFLAAEEAAKTPEEKAKVYRELDPRNAMAKYYLAFEEKHRGTRAAFLAINAGIGSAVSVADPEIDASKGRNEMVSRLLEHYLDSEELSSVFDGFSGGPLVPERNKILEMAMKHSPHRKVRAEAFLYAAEYAMKDLREAEMLPLYRRFVQEKMSAYPERYQRESQQRIDELAAIDQDELRSQALRWLDVIETAYGDIRVDSYGSHYNKKLSVVVSRLRYALTNIIVGNPAPEIDFTDINGTPIKLSQLKGKPVVLTLCFNHGSELENQDLAKKYVGKNVEFVTIVGIHKIEEFKKKYPREKLLGAIGVEPISKGEIRGNWNVNSATTFLIDKEGILRRNSDEVGSAGEWLDEQLK